MSENYSLLAIDVGSSHVKFGWFSQESNNFAAATLPEPALTFRVEHRGGDGQWIDEVERRLGEADGVRRGRGRPGSLAACVVASVHPRAAVALSRNSLEKRCWSKLTALAATDLPIELRVDEPSRVGIDRLLGALAANRLRDPNLPAIVVDMGTATTVNLIAADGAFEGGAILAGPMTNLAALHNATASLPLLGVESLAEPPAAVGKSTERALAAGAYWGALGAVKELAERIADGCGTAPELFLTGGAASAFAPHLSLGGRPARYVPHLVLAGIFLAGQDQSPP